MTPELHAFIEELELRIGPTFASELRTRVLRYGKLERLKGRTETADEFGETIAAIRESLVAELRGGNTYELPRVDDGGLRRTLRSPADDVKTQEQRRVGGWELVEKEVEECAETNHSS